MLRVVQNLHLMVLAAERGPHIQDAAAHDDDGVRLPVCPERAVRQSEASGLPNLAFIQNGMKIADNPLFHRLHLLSV
ncbi:hypothetical protein D3C73_1219660 [compost metagenome]